MSCEPLAAELDAYLDGELEPERAAEIAAHVAGCSACARLLAERRAVARALHSLPRPSAPAGFMDRFRAAREARGVAAPPNAIVRPAPGFWRRSWLVGSAAAAAAALLLAVSLHDAVRKAPVGMPDHDRGCRPQAAPSGGRHPKAHMKPAEESRADRLPEHYSQRDGVRGPMPAETPPLQEQQKLHEQAGHKAETEDDSAPAIASIAPPKSGAAGSPASAPAPAAAPPAPPAPGAFHVEKETKGDLLARRIENRDHDSADKRREPAMLEEAARERSTGRKSSRAANEPDLTLDREVRGNEWKKLQDDSQRRSFALRADDAESAARQLVLIAEGLGGRQMALAADGKAAEARWDAPQDRPAEGQAPANSAPPASHAEMAKPTTAAPTAPPAAAGEPAAAVGGARQAGKDTATWDRADARQIVLAVPADRLEAFRKALTLWSESADKGAERKSVEKAEAPEKLAAEASDGLGFGARRVALRCAIVGALTAMPGGGAGHPDVLGAADEADRETGAAAGGGGAPGYRGKAGVVYLVITLTSDEQ